MKGRCLASLQWEGNKMDLAQKYIENIGTKEMIEADFLEQTKNRFSTKRIELEVSRKQVSQFVRENGIEFSRNLTVNSEIIGTVFVFINKKGKRIILNIELDRFLLPDDINLDNISFDVLGDFNVKVGFNGAVSEQKD